MSISGHVDENVLELYAMNRLSEGEAESIEDHLALCSHCLDRLDETRAFVEGMQLALPKQAAADAAKVSIWKRFQGWAGVPVWAGAALAAAGVLFLINRPDNNLSAPAMIMLDGTRGASTVVHGKGPFDFEMFMPTEGKTYHVELLDEGGAKRWQGDVPGDHGTLHAVIKQRMPEGQYYLHVVEPVSGSRHDYAVRIER